MAKRWKDTLNPTLVGGHQGFVDSKGDGYLKLNDKWHCSEKHAEHNHGTVKHLNRGMGFISVPGRKDIFFHHSSVYGTGFDSLRVGQPVSFGSFSVGERLRTESVTPYKLVTSAAKIKALDDRAREIAKKLFLPSNT